MDFRIKIFPLLAVRCCAINSMCAFLLSWGWMFCLIPDWLSFFCCENSVYRMDGWDGGGMSFPRWRVGGEVQIIRATRCVYDMYLSHPRWMSLGKEREKSGAGSDRLFTKNKKKKSKGERGRDMVD